MYFFRELFFKNIQISKKKKKIIVKFFKYFSNIKIILMPHFPDEIEYS